MLTFDCSCSDLLEIDCIFAHAPPKMSRYSSMEIIWVIVGGLALIGFLLVGVPVLKLFIEAVIASFSFRTTLIIGCSVWLGIARASWFGGIIGFFASVAMSFIAELVMDPVIEQLVALGWKKLEERIDD